MTTSTINTPSQTPVQTIAQPTQSKSKRQFSLATLLLAVLWLASGYSIWFYWQPWVMVGEYENILNELWYAQDGSKLMIVTGSDSGEIDVRTGALVGRSPFNPPLSWWWRPADNSDWVVCDRRGTKPGAIEIHNKRNGALEQTLDGDSFCMDGHFSADGEQLYNYGKGESIDVYRWKKKALEWRIKPLREEKELGEAPSPPLIETAEEAEKRRVCERGVCAAQSLTDLAGSVEQLANLPLGPSRLDALLSPNADLAVTILSTKDSARAFSWDLSTGLRIAELEGFRSSEPEYGVFSVDGRFFGAMDTAGGRAAVWDLATGRAIGSWKIADEPLKSVNMVLSRDARLAVTGTGAGIRIWECSTGRMLSELPYLGYLTFFPDGHRLAGIPSDGLDNLELFDTESGVRLCALPIPARPCGVSVKCAPDGRSLVVVGYNPGGANARVYWCHHPESAYGWLAMPVAWVFIALSLILLWRLARKLTMRAAFRTQHSPL